MKYYSTSYTQFVIGLILSFLMMIVGYEAKIKFLYKKLERTQKQIVITEKQIQYKKQEIQRDRLAKQKLQLTRISLENEPIQPASAIEIANILNILEQKMVAARVNANLFEPDTKQEKEDFMIYPIKLELDGTYKNLLMFINSIFQLSYLITIEDFNLQKKRNVDTDDLNMQVLLMIYKNKYPTVENVRNPSIPISEHDIFKQETNRKNLYLWSSRELLFLGTIKQKEKTFAVISDPLGNVYRVTISDKIGLNQSKISAINEKGIVTAYSGEIDR